MALLTALTNTIAVDNTGKLPVGLIPDSVTGALNYQGTWNAATNTPTLANGTGTKGHYYKVAVQGTFNIGGIDFWNLGDIISYNGSTWDRIDGGINEVVEGPQGPTGPAGPMGQTGGPGPAGQTLYTWFAYADNATGTVNFTNGAWTNQTYLGIAVNKTTPTESTNPADYTWSKMQGPPGAQGTTGSAGAAGPQGDSMFTWIAYANSADGTLNFTTGASSGHTYIGIANNKTSAVESTNPTQYVWSKIQGEDGVPGTPGINGETTYTWFAYANNATGTVGFTTGAWTNQTYLGLAVNKLTATESQNPADYTWSKMQGDQGATGPTGAAGPQGNSMYTWIAYANSADGTLNFTTGASSGHTYIGLANNKTSSTESTNPVDYTWSKIQGDAGVPGTPGANGQTTYTWFAYANSADGTSGFTTGAWTNQT
jgi:IS1 family transposase